MRAPPLPISGPIRFDCRESTAVGAVRTLDETIRRMRPGPRTLIVVAGTPEVLDACSRWARQGKAPHEVVPGPQGPEVRIYLLPAQFGGHPAHAFVKPVLLPVAAEVPAAPQPTAH